LPQLWDVIMTVPAGQRHDHGLAAVTASAPARCRGAAVLESPIEHSLLRARC
jgi:hypothetical protein